MSNLYIRGEAPKDNFTIIENSLIEDTSLSPHARLLMIYVFSRPAGWEFRKKDILNILQCGDSVYRRVIAELKAKGFLVLKRPRSEDGKHNKGTVYEFTRGVEKPHLRKPEPQKTHVLSNTNNYNNTEKDSADESATPEKTKPKPKKKPARVQDNPDYQRYKSEIERVFALLSIPCEFATMETKIITALFNTRRDTHMPIEDIEPYMRFIASQDYLTDVTPNILLSGKMRAKFTSHKSISEDKFNFNNPLWTTH